MRRRNDPAATTGTTVETTGVSGAPGYDWTTKDAPTGEPGPRTIAKDIEKGSRAGILLALSIMPKDGPAADPHAVSVGDLLTITIGKEVYYPGGREKFNGFEVGPLAMTVTVRQGESAAQAWARCRTVLEHLHQAEIQLRITEFTDHFEQARKSIRGGE